ncbi:MAG: ABC-type metal ion transport system, periplasmic component/surface adhesin [Acidimicrobiales bacterium]|jgi:zinc transport system substrate-binding protein|nr:ABC-type metal ion transport system, periplasmic component/surface adhesin [Acidimicrobiales bacterium]
MRIILTLAVAAGLLASGCGSDAKSASANGGRIHVVASFYPLAEAASQVGGTDVQVDNLTRPGSEPHDLELSTKQVDALEGADLVVLLGRGFQPVVEESARRRPKGTTLSVLDTLTGVGTGTVAAEGESGGVDPHVWLDPNGMHRIVAAVTDSLTAVAPAKKAAFEQRAAAYEQQLDDLAGRFADGLKTCRTKTIVTSHAAFGWLARSYGLQQEAISGLSPEQEPDPRRLATLVDLVQKRHVTTIFTETLVSPKVADTLAREAGVKTDVLDPLEGLTKDRVAAGDDYISVMDDNLARLRVALGC